MNHSWSGVIHAVRAHARKAYTRSLRFARRVRYEQLCLLSKIWYMAQLVPLTKVHAQQLTTICTWFRRQGVIFRIPVTTLQRPKCDGGWGFPHIDAKCRTVLYNWIQTLGKREGNVISEEMCNGTLMALCLTLLMLTGSHLSSSTYDNTRLIWPMCPLTP
jgi:hypothetical protein